MYRQAVVTLVLVVDCLSSFSTVILPPLIIYRLCFGVFTPNILSVVSKQRGTSRCKLQADDRTRPRHYRLSVINA